MDTKLPLGYTITLTGERVWRKGDAKERASSLRVFEKQNSESLDHTAGFSIEREAGVLRRAPLAIPRVIFLCLLLSCALPGQVGKTDDYLKVSRFSRDLREIAEVPGDRLAKAGKERTAMTGTLTMGGKTTATVVTWELPGKLRIERGGEKTLTATATPLAPTASQESLSTVEEALVESLLNDRQEAFLYEVSNGAGARPVGLHVYQSKDAALKRVGPVVNIYETIARPDTRAKSAAKAKRYYFDFFNGQLARVVYFVTERAGSVLVETVLSDWRSVDGASFPAMIERRHNGVIVFSFKAESVGVSAKIGDLLMEKP